MITFDFIKTKKHLLKQIDNLSIKPSDVHYITLYEEYSKMMHENKFKKSYIMNELSLKYKIEIRTLYRIIKRFSSEIKQNIA